MEVTVNVGIFKKGLLKEVGKYFHGLTPHTENLLVGQFTMRDLTDEYTLGVVVSDDMRMKVVLCGNKYENFEAVLANLKFILSA